MTRGRITVALTLAAVALSSYAIRADVRTDEKSRFQLGGVLGRVVNIFGGKAAREGVTSSTAVKGDRLAKMTDTSGQIIDLGEEKIYDLDLRKKNYSVTTFDELRRRMEEARRKAEENARKAEESASKANAKEARKRDPNEKEVEVDFDLKETGQKKAINGFDTREVVMTITLREKGKTLEQAGGMVVTDDMWLAPKVPGMNEIADFYQRYARKIQGPMMPGASAQDLAAAMAMYPMMKQAIARMNAENVKMDGTAISSIITMDAVQSAEEAAQTAKRGDDDSKAGGGSGLGDLLNGLAKRRAAQKKTEGQNENESENKARATFMTMTSEVLKVTTAVSAADVGIPAGFKENK
jgi:hypothetical protein